MQIILASGSPRRREILALLKIPFEVVVSHMPEKTDKTKPEELVCDLSAQKAENVFALCSQEGRLQEQALVIGADTIVYHNGSILGKPKDKAHACRMLQSLQNDVHQVYTGVTYILQKGENITRGTFYETTDVCMYGMSDEEILRYVETKEPMDKAGAYAVQGIGMVNIRWIRGDYQNVVGLPLAGLYRRLQSEGIDLLG